jgi:hypothetical protein
MSNGISVRNVHAVDCSSGFERRAIALALPAFRR